MNKKKSCMNEAKIGKLLPIRNQINIVYVNSLMYKINITAKNQEQLE